MIGIDDPTAATVQPTPEAAGTAGFFTEGSPGVTAATKVRASWLNAIQNELLAFLTDVSITPVKTTYNQVLTAVKTLIQRGSPNSAVAAGTSDAITASFTPAITAWTSGMTLRVRASAANTTTTPTLSANGLAAVTIAKGVNAALVAGDIQGAGAWITLVYDATFGKLIISNPATGVASTYGPKAWVVFAGATGTILKGSPGITSVTRNSTGDYTINISAGVLADTNYGATFGCEATGANVSSVVTGKVSGTKTQTAYQITAYINTGTPTTLDPATVTVALFD